MEPIKPYRKKPVIDWISDPITVDNINEIATWCNGRVMTPIFALDDETQAEIEIQCMDAIHYARMGDRVIYLIGEYQPLNEQNFEKLYETEPVR